MILACRSRLVPSMLHINSILWICVEYEYMCAEYMLKCRCTHRLLFPVLHTSSKPELPRMSNPKMSTWSRVGFRVWDFHLDILGMIPLNMHNHSTYIQFVEITSQFPTSICITVVKLQKTIMEKY